MRQRARAALAIAAIATFGAVGACSTPVRPDDPDLGGQTVEVLGVWQDDEAQKFGAVLERFARRTRAVVQYTSTNGEDVRAVLDARIAEGRPPDLALVPQPGLLARYAAAGVLVPIGDLVGDPVRENWSAEWQRLGTVDGKLYGVWFKAAHKSLIWYDIATFERAGVVPPSDIDGLVAVANAVVASGSPAFAVGSEDQWTLTDWFENIYLRLAGPARYDALAERRLPWTHPTVARSLALLATLLSPPIAATGPEGLAATSFPETVRLVFESRPPSAAMVAEGDFVSGVIDSTDATLGVDADVFAFPDADPARRLVVGGGDAVVMFRSSPASRALLADLASPAAAEVWARLGGFVSPNEDVDLAAYPDPISRAIARSLIEAGDGFRFDLSDLQPAAFGGTTGAGMFGILADFVDQKMAPEDAASALEAAAAEGAPLTGAEGLGGPTRPPPRSLRPFPLPTRASSARAGSSS